MLKRMKGLACVMGAVVVTLVPTLQSRANLLPPPTSSIVGDPASHALPTGTLLATISNASYTYASPGDGTGGKYTVSVWSDTSNTFASGDITITVSVSPGTNNDISTVQVGFYDSFLLDIYANNAGGQVASTGVSRASGGNNIDINFPSSPYTLLGGTTSETFILMTNATNYTAGEISFQDGGSSGNLASFEPAGPVPLPATASMSLGLFGLIGGVGAVGALRRRRAAMA